MASKILDHEARSAVVAVLRRMADNCDYRDRAGRRPSHGLLREADRLPAET